MQNVYREHITFNYSRLAKLVDKIIFININELKVKSKNKIFRSWHIYEKLNPFLNKYTLDKIKNFGFELEQGSYFPLLIDSKYYVLEGKHRVTALQTINSKKK